MLTRCQWRWHLSSAGFASATVLLLSVVALLPAQSGNATLPRQPFPPIISTKDPEVVPARAQTSPTELPRPTAVPALTFPAKNPSPLPGENVLPIDLVTAMRLANVRPLEIALTQQRLAQAGAQLKLANVLWLPTLDIGGDYFRHDGRTQDPASASIADIDESSLMAGVGPSLIVAVTDAFYEPLAARQVVAARQASVQAAQNDSLLAVAEAYFNVQQARGELAGAEDTVTRATYLLQRATQLAGEKLAPPAEENRARAELARRRQTVQSARERWRTASAELARLLRLEPSVLVNPQEPPQMQVAVVPMDQPVEDLILIGLTNRPEMAAEQALVQAALERLRREKMRPWLPSVLLRGASTNPTGTFAGGVFAAGKNEMIGDPGARLDIDLQLVWEFQNLGFGNQGRIAEQRAVHEATIVEAYRVHDRVAAEVMQAHAKLVSARDRVRDAEEGLKQAMELLQQNIEGLSQTMRIGNKEVLVVRPQEAVAALQSLAAAYPDYYGSIGDFNRAEFHLYRALGQPANKVFDPEPACGAAATPLLVPPESH